MSQKTRYSENSFLIVFGREAGAVTLQQLKVGDEVSIEYAPKVSNGQPLKFAIRWKSDSRVKDGEVQPVDDSVTALGQLLVISADGKEMYLCRSRW